MSIEARYNEEEPIYTGIWAKEWRKPEQPWQQLTGTNMLAFAFADPPGGSVLILEYLESEAAVRITSKDHEQLVAGHPTADCVWVRMETPADRVPLPPTALKEMVRDVLNAASAENGSNTPDHVLAEYLLDCLRAFDSATQARDRHYGIAPEPANPYRKES